MDGKGKHSLLKILIGSKFIGPTEKADHSLSQSYLKVCLSTRVGRLFLHEAPDQHVADVPDPTRLAEIKVFLVNPCPYDNDLA